MSVPNQNPSPLCTIKREQLKVSIRKEKLCSLFETKRLKFQIQPTLPNPSDEYNAAELSVETRISKHANSFLEALEGQKKVETFNHLQAIRELVNLEVDKQNTEIVKILENTGLLNILINLLHPTYFVDEELMDEVFWILINGALFFDNYYWDLVKGKGLIEKCIQIVMNPKSLESLIKNALWFLANTPEDNNGMREHLLSINFLDQILFWIEKSENPLQIQSHFIFMIQNFIKVKPIIVYSQIEKYIPVIIEYLHKVDDWMIHNWCLTGLSTLCVEILGNDDHLLDQFVKVFKLLNGFGSLLQIVDKTMALDAPEADKLLIKVTKIVGTISYSENHRELDYFLDKGVLDLLCVLFEHKSYIIKRNTAWILSNFMVGTPNQISKIMLNERLIDRALYLLRFGTCSDTKYNLLMAFNNCLNSVTDFSFTKLSNKGLLKIYYEVINPFQDKISFIEVALAGISSFMSLIEDDEVLKSIGEVESVGGKQKLENLCYHQNDGIRQQASFILDEFFAGLEADIILPK